MNKENYRMFMRFLETASIKELELAYLDIEKCKLAFVSQESLREAQRMQSEIQLELESRQEVIAARSHLNELPKHS